MFVLLSLFTCHFSPSILLADVGVWVGALAGGRKEVQERKLVSVRKNFCFLVVVAHNWDRKEPFNESLCCQKMIIIHLCGDISSELLAFLASFLKSFGLPPPRNFFSGGGKGKRCNIETWYVVA